MVSFWVSGCVCVGVLGGDINDGLGDAIVIFMIGQPNTRPNTTNTNSTHQADGLPLVYEPEVIKKYWDKRPSEMQRRWALFLSVTAPFITKLVRRFTSGTILQVLGCFCVCF